MITSSRLLAISLLLATLPANADNIGCVTTAWKLIGANHKVCVEAFSDPKVPGVTCHVSQARTGGYREPWDWRRIRHSFP